jgi:glycerophosphoryl diester phosphodiesterase
MQRSARFVLLASLLASACTPADGEDVSHSDPEREKLLIAHRGASAYAPEHTREAYQLALDQGADYLEPDLQLTRDGVLIALHDLTLERTTNVREVFPERFREEEAGGQSVRRWYASDFTLEEIKSLDAGSWFDESFAGARVMTLAEVIEMARGRAGIIPETKSPEVYGALGMDMERLLVEELGRHGLARRGADQATPVIIQSFSPTSLRALRHDLGSDLPLTLLVSAPDGEGWLTEEGLRRARDFADGVGPAKGLLLDDPAVVTRAHALGMTVIPYTFRSASTGNFPDVTAEMSHFLHEIGVDGLFTDNPDLFPRIQPGAAGW